MADEASELSARLSEQAAELAELLASADGVDRAGVDRTFSALATTARRLGDLLGDLLGDPLSDLLGESFGVDVDAADAPQLDAGPGGPQPLPPVEVTAPVLGV